MKELVYPAVVYEDKDNGGYVISIADLEIVAQGDTVVDAYVNAKLDLCAMVDCAIKFECDIESPTDFMKVYKTNKNSIVLLIDALS